MLLCRYVTSVNQALLFIKRNYLLQTYSYKNWNTTKGIEFLKQNWNLYLFIFIFFFLLHIFIIN